MSFLIKTSFQEVANFIKPLTNVQVCARHKSKKTIGAVHNAGNSNPKYRGIKKHDGSYVHAGGILVTQRKTRFHPGLNVGFGRDGTMNAMVHGRVAITCEIINPDYNHFWVRKNYAGREGQLIYKKHLNVIPEKQHDHFVLKDAI